MSLTSAMFTGIGGLNSYGDAMNVIGDNISNVNTIGFKSSRAIFTDLLATSISGRAANVQVGHGASLGNINLNLLQGATEATGNATDMAIQGNGFFIVGDSTNRAYTRAGQFILNKDGLLVNSTEGKAVQGYSLDANGDATGSLTEIDLAGFQSVPRATSFFRISTNLDAAASAGTTFQTPINLYNSLGELVTLSINCTKSTTSREWNYSMSATTEGGTSGALTITGGTGTLVFDSSGALTLPTTEPSITITGFATGASDLTAAWDILTDTGSQRGELTSYAAFSATSAIVQDGYSTGTLKGVSTTQDGIISGLFSNGQTQELMQLGLANFLSPWGLTRMGGSLFAESADSGQPILGTAKSGNFGAVINNSLELSNVDLAGEFVSLIQNQRAYQANSRIITTVDEMLAETINIKR